MRAAYTLRRGFDGDPGGTADLQTDVMRFMAILSLCLVAIFALVQSIPPAPSAPKAPTAAAAAPDRPPPAAAERPEAPPTGAAPAAEPMRTPAPEPIQTPAPEPIRTPAAEPIRTPAPEPIQTAAAEPAQDPRPVAAAPRKASPAAPPTAMTPAPAPNRAAERKGFALRFESDQALLALAARQEVGVYAIAGEKAQRMDLERGRIGFWPASVPGRFHEMDPATVPRDVVAALRGSAGSPAAVRWGVTLPDKLAKQLDAYLAQADGGELIIAADGRLRLE